MLKKVFFGPKIPNSDFRPQTPKIKIYIFFFFKDYDKKKGLIGEFLVQLLFSRLCEDFKPISILFNTEEKSFKKKFPSDYH